MTTSTDLKKMEIIYDPIFLDHDTGMYPENRKRLFFFNSIADSSHRVPSGEDYLTLVHTPDYVRLIKGMCERGRAIDHDTIVSKGSYRAAVHAVGATLEAAERGAFALVRPPGHHAYPSKASGFCLFNNVAVAAQMLANEGKRVLVFDFDGHLGDGTEAIFYESDKVMFWSIHQLPGFPGMGDAHEVGSGKGKGFTINVPLPPESGDDIFMDAVKTFLPIAKQFQPDVVAVSAGFDAHRYDLLLELNVTVNSFFKIGQLLRQHFDKVFAVLEGGYNVEELHKCIYSFLEGYNGGAKVPFVERNVASRHQTWQEYEMRCNRALQALQPYWRI